MRATNILRTPALLLVLLLVPSLWPTAVRAGGNLGAFDTTEGAPGPLPGTTAVEIVERKWDPRCLPVRYVLRGDLPANLPVDDLAAEFQTAMDRWNTIPTSFIDFQLDRVAPSEPATGFGFDMVNELSFTAQFFGAVSPSVALVEDTQLAAGDDLDLDGDSDVFDPTNPQDPGFGIEICKDVDGDGDHEFPAGFYRAGTMVDDDILFGAPEIVPWTLDPTAPGLVVDVQALAVHELGHSHGLAHSPINQLGANDGRGAVMFPFIDLSDPNEQLSQRIPAEDDAAWSSLLNPEGTAATGAAALQPGDVAFEDVYTVVTGEVLDGETGKPLSGGAIAARDRLTGTVRVGAFTGSSRYFLDATGLVVDPTQQDFHIPDGSYRLPLPNGEYHFQIEAVDNHPASAPRFNDATFFGKVFEQNDFNEEIFSKKDPEKGLKEIKVKAKTVQPPPVVDYTTAAEQALQPFDRLGFGPETDFDGIGFILPPGFIYATRFPASELQAVIDGGNVFKSGSYFTFTVDASFVPVFSRAALVTGTVNQDGTVATLDLDNPLIVQAPFVAQQGDDSPFFFPEPRKVTRDIERAIEGGATDIFLVLELSDQVSPVLGFPPFVGLDSGQEAGLLGRSYFSFGEPEFTQFPPWNWMFRLIFASAS